MIMFPCSPPAFSVSCFDQKKFPFVSPVMANAFGALNNRNMSGRRTEKNLEILRLTYEILCTCRAHVPPYLCALQNKISAPMVQGRSQE